MAMPRLLTYAYFACCIILIATSFIVLHSNDRVKTLNRNLSQLAFNSYEDKAPFLCLVMTRPNSIDRQEAIIETWGANCSHLLFLMGSESLSDSYIEQRQPHVYNLLLNVKDDYYNTWMKVRAALLFIDRRWRKKFDWIIRIDDDSYLIFENLIPFLKPHPPTVPIQFGCHLIRYLGGYIQTGPGIVLSQAAFQRLMYVFENSTLCNTTAQVHADDLMLGRCLKRAGVPYGDGSDGTPNNRPRFLMANLDELVHNQSEAHSTFFHAQSAYKVGDGYDCCAEDLIGLHYLSASDIRRIHNIIQNNPDKRKNARLLSP